LNELPTAQPPQPDIMKPLGYHALPPAWTSVPAGRPGRGGRIVVTARNPGGWLGGAFAAEGGSRMPDPTPPPEYVIGHSAREHRRLIAQARLYGDLTERLFRQAGIVPGMRVLDAGCGVGDVSLLAASLVGPKGAVVGVDRAPEAIEAARSRARQALLEHVSFLSCGLDALPECGTFDAVVGRLVLMYQPDPVATLRRLLERVRPDGLVVFQEMEMGMARALEGEAPLYELCENRIRETFRKSGFETDMGSRLFAAFRDAGLPDPEMNLEGRVDGRAGSPMYAAVAEVVRSLLPSMVRLGIATEEEVEIDTLALRLELEVLRTGAVLLMPPLIGAWARRPA
jgi:SAM-dependent methyltransferase